MFSRSEKSRDRRRRFSIHAYQGPNGSGKTLAMVRDTIPSLNAGRRVLSTVRMLDPETGGPHPLYSPLTSWQQLLDARGCDVLLDEVQGVANSRGHQGLPPAILTTLLQLRRRDVLLRWTSPSFARADLVLREVTQAVTDCRGFWPEPLGERAWRPNRLFWWRTYEAYAFDEWSSGKQDEVGASIREFYARLRDEERADHWYDSMDSVDYIRDVVETGACIRCGGSRRRPKCECDDDAHQDSRPPRSEARTDGGPSGLAVVDSAAS